MPGAACIPLNLPRPARVRTEGAGVPVEVDGRAVELIRESWLVEDRWWTERPLRRRYWEAVTMSGRNVVVFHDLNAAAPGAADLRPGRPAVPGSWFLQRP